MENSLKYYGTSSLTTFGAGLLISRERSRHMDRICDHFDLIFVREGLLPIKEEDHAFEVGAGQSLLLWPGRRHVGTRDYLPGLRLYWLHFYHRPDMGEPAISVPQFATVSRPDFVESLFRRFMDEEMSGRLIPSYANALAHLVICEVAERSPMPTSENAPAAALAARAIAHIRSHSGLPMTASKVARELGYNPTYLNRVFHKVYNHTLTAEIQLTRLEYACYLLMHSNKNVSEIAYECGFKDAPSFHRLFKRYEGMPATVFRRLYTERLLNGD